MVDLGRYQAIVDEEMRNMDRMENECIPSAKLSSSEVGDVVNGLGGGGVGGAD